MFHSLMIFYSSRYVKELDEAKARVEKAEKEGSPNLESLKKALANIETKTEDMKKQWSEFEKKEKVSDMKSAF